MRHYEVVRFLFGALVLLELLGLLLTPVARPVEAASVGPQLVPSDASDGSPAGTAPGRAWCDKSPCETETETDDANPLAPGLPGLSMMRQSARQALAPRQADGERPGTCKLPERPPRRRS